jgi:hypothetical protein
MPPSNVASTVYNAPPLVQYGTAMPTSRRIFLVDLFGTGFTKQSKAILNGNEYQTTLASPTQIQAELGNEQVSGFALTAAVREQSSSPELSNTIEIVVPQNIASTAPSAIPFQDAVGCEDPNAIPPKVTSGAWNPTYINDVAASFTMGKPSYTSDFIFWVSP